MNSSSEGDRNVLKNPICRMLAIAERCSAVVSDANAIAATFRSGSTPGKPGYQPG
jgi:hypothetical protein